MGMASRLIATLAPNNIERESERILRSLPLWFGQEGSLLEYIRDSSILPTWVTMEGDIVNGFATLRQHFPQAYEVHCIAVHAQSRGKGYGRALIESACAWVHDRGGKFVQVKTLGPSAPSPEYGQTRAFYAHLGFVPIEEFATLWAVNLPCLQMIKYL
jgi:GNAT superfamily N-acetyltransferase